MTASEQNPIRVSSLAEAMLTLRRRALEIEITRLEREVEEQRHRFQEEFREWRRREREAIRGLLEQYGHEMDPDLVREILKRLDAEAEQDAAAERR